MVSGTRHKTRLQLACKRAIDILASGVGLVLLSPLLAVTVLAIKLESAGPVLFRQGRAGFRGRPFDLIKFRTTLDARDAKPQRIYHLAAPSSPSESLRNPSLTYDVNFGGTLNLFLVWLRLEMDCRFLFVSSSQVYGSARPEDLPLREHLALRPATPYAGSKAAGELLAIRFFESYGFPIVRARPFNHTGPRQSPAFVRSDFARHMAEINLGQTPPSVTGGNLKVTRDFSDVRDIVRGYEAVLERGVAGEVYQLGTGRPVAVEEVLQTLLRLRPKQVEVVVDPSRLRPAEAPAA